MKDRLIREAKNLLVLLVIAIVFSALFILGNLIFRGEMPRWK